MGNSHLKNPLYRLFNVILFLLYTCVILVALFAGSIGYSERNLTHATLQCKDGSRWNAMDIRNDSEVLCGICTKREPSGKYYNCSYPSDDYSSYQIVDEQYDWSWNTIIYPLIIFLVGFGVVDFLRLAIIYIFFGGIYWDKSILLQILIGLIEGLNSEESEDFKKQAAIQEKYREEQHHKFWKSKTGRFLDFTFWGTTTILILLFAIPLFAFGVLYIVKLIWE